MEIDIMDHVGLVRKAIYSQPWLFQTGIMEYDDCEQEGMIALMEATETYDPKQGTFANYAFPRIIWHLQRINRQSGQTIRKPEQLNADYYKCREIAADYKRKYFESPSYKTLARLSGFSLSKIKRIHEAFQPVGSLNQPMNEDDYTLEDTIEDERDYFLDIERKLCCIALKKEFERIMDEALTANDSNILKDYFAWDGGIPPTLEVMSLKHHCTKGDIQSSIKRSLIKLKYYRYLNVLRRKFPELIAQQIYSMDPTSPERRAIRTMVINLFQFYAGIGDLIEVNNHLAVITEIKTSAFAYKISGYEYIAFFKSFKDIEIKDERITKLYIA